MVEHHPKLGKCLHSSTVLYANSNHSINNSFNGNHHFDGCFTFLYLGAYYEHTNLSLFNNHPNNYVFLSDWVVFRMIWNILGYIGSIVLIVFFFYLGVGLIGGFLAILGFLGYMDHHEPIFIVIGVVGFLMMSFTIR